MAYTKVNISKCRIIFFDLEFYVPASSRLENGFSYNPWDKGCKLIGGSFLLANPESDFSLTEKKLTKKIQSHWIWDHQTELKLLQSIYEILKSAVEIVHNAHNGTVSPILCGIGITSSDVPIIFELFKRYKILSNAEAFKLQNKFRVIDLSLLAIATFNNPNHFLYPKSKSHILHKYLHDKKIESGRSVWELYEQKDFTGIARRVVDEVITTHNCYGLIKSDLDKFKRLEATDKKHPQK